MDNNGRGVGLGERAVSGTGRALQIAGARFHLIGAGGTGMSGLAALLLKHGAIVTGSDRASSPTVRALQTLGADIRIGHCRENLMDGVDAVVVSAAIKEDNPELRSARQRGVAVYKYAQMLGELMDGYEGIAIAGTHGKSTTSGWLTYCLQQAGLEPSFIVGAVIHQLGSSSGVADGRFFVAEACEYDRSFLNLRPKIGCILNIEQDHLDYYKDEEEIVEAFEQFALNVRPDGVLVACGSDVNVKRVLERVRPHRQCQTFGLEAGCDFQGADLVLEEGLYRFTVYHQGHLVGTTRISVPGLHNVTNALAVVAMAVNAGLEPGEVLELLPGFVGMERRLMLKGKVGQITVLDDYAHHPTEIRASLSAIRQLYQPRRLWCVFQPHQYSRTRFFLDEFASSFTLADVTIVPQIYFVRDSEQSRRQVNAEVLVDRLRQAGSEAVFIDDFDAICEYLKRQVGPGDVVVTMGAGDVWKVADEYIRWLGADS